MLSTLNDFIKAMNGLIKEMKKVSDLRKESLTLLNNASTLRNDSSELLKRLNDLSKKVSEGYEDETQQNISKYTQLAEQFHQKIAEAEEKEKNANSKETEAINMEKNVIDKIATLSNECGDSPTSGTKEFDGKKFMDDLKDYFESAWKLDTAFLEWGTDSLKRDMASKKRDADSLEMKEKYEDVKKKYEEIKDIHDCVENSKTLQKHKEKTINDKKKYCSIYLIVSTIIWLYIAGNLLGWKWGIGISEPWVIALLCTILLLFTCLIIVLARRFHRINTALHKMDALILRMELTTDRDLGKPYRLDRELDMIYKILE